jgi:TonB family protein
MTFDSSTICARTAAGEAELATPSQGLALGQRRVLALLQEPVAVDELAHKHRLDPVKLERDLTRLADLELVLLQGPSIAPALAPPAAMTEAMPMAPVVIGSHTRLSPTVALMAAIAASVLAAGIWYGTRASPAPAETTRPIVAAPAPAPVPAAMAPATAPLVVGTTNTITGAAPPATPAAAPDLTLQDTAAPTSARPPSRKELAALARATAKAATATALPVPVPIPAARREPAGGLPTVVPTEAAPVPAAPAAPVAASATMPIPAADTPPPVQVAAATPSLAPPRPAASAGLKAISREPPDFPREAVADGLKRGLVNARIHVDARGNVTGVDILASQPPKVFDRAARRALLLWQFEPNASGQSSALDVDVKFQRD